MSLQTYAIIENELVINIVEYEEQPTNPPAGFPEGTIAVLANGVSPGWKYTDSVFTAPQPYPSWTLIDNKWQPPTPRPEDEKLYEWDEETLSWKER
jgi:hypothetical protein